MMPAWFLALPFLLALAPAALADDPIVTIILKDHQFIPAKVPVPAGTKVQLVIKNEQPMSAEFESKVLHREKVMSAGAQISVYVGPLDPGSYEFFDDFNPASRGHLVAK